MSRPYRLTERAKADVEAISDFIAADSIGAALKVVLALEDAFLLLAARPDIGHVREDLTSHPLKFWSVYSYLVVYDPAMPAKICSAPGIAWASCCCAGDCTTAVGTGRADIDSGSTAWNGRKRPSTWSSTIICWRSII